MNSLVVLLACLAAASASGWAGAYPHWAHGGAWGPWAHGGGWAGPWAGHSAYWAGNGGHWAGHGAHWAGYHGAQHVPVVLPSGYLADTPEVAHAKSAHYTALADAAHRSHDGYAHGYGYGHGWAGAHGHLAVPVVLPSGHLADTPDVAAVKHHHLNALAAQGGATHNYGHGYPYGYAHGYHH